MYVLFEGVDGVGKSTQIELLAKKYKNVVVTKEPGGSEFGVYMRDILLGGKFALSSHAEALLFLADRAEHYAKVIAPNSNKLILSDRGFVSGVAYALANDENADINELINLNKFALNKALPDRVVLFLADENLIKNRLKSRDNLNGIDTIEARGVTYLLRVQECMKMVVATTNLQTLFIKADENIEQINKKITEFINF
ncbi:dTMP kinase [Campylobacter sp. faydin G-105]|uniref:dTMP kinase n=1 Tax=Campylobacter anatolicus TaxID=2829105 RepID=UPI001B92FFDE|nr:dTMP kinase [Campylobacter anatolicus]MBR8462875.1 dTMP kinase [Campylobacter anatolicus]